MNKKMEFRIDNDLKQDFIRICELQDKVPSKVLRNMIESYVAENISDYELYIEPFIAECEEILSQKIDEALQKDSLVSYLTDGTTNDVKLINELLNYLSDYNIVYDLENDIYYLNWIDPSGNPECDGEFNDARELVDYFLDLVL